ncbi:Aldo-keto reductase str7 [Marasmius tenuissimus]|uniref:Aldo-keto reductase str7 n=1 Tax=Marasmius tenuissimus TaxID=585030 RepID=A0ABR3A8H7_9AGAR
MSVVDRLGDIGKKHNATPGQVTLAWILAQGDDFVVIPGTKKIKYLEENMGAAKVKLSDDEKSQIRKLAEEADAIPGNRYGPGAIETVYVESPPLKL